MTGARQIAAALAAGLLFGAGLAVSGMINPAKVLGFLDVAGDWDPTLLLVMAGALAVTLPGYALVRRRSEPLFAEVFQIPTRKDIDNRLVGGAVLFGIGWGLVGFCPGPALAALGGLQAPVWIFFASLLAGMGLYRVLARQ